LSKTKKEEFSTKVRTQLLSFTKKWIGKKAKANVNLKTESTSFLIALILLREKDWPKASKETMTFRPILKKTFP
jgi:hypothetical protein